MIKGTQKTEVLQTKKYQFLKSAQQNYTQKTFTSQ